MMNRPLLIFILFFAVFALLIFWNWPRYQEWRSLQATVKEKEAELQNREAYFANLRETKRKVENLPEKVAKLNAALPNSPNLPRLYDSMQRISAASGLALRNIAASLQQTTQPSSLQSIDMRLQVRGSYSALKDFLFRLQRASRLTSVHSVTFSTATEQGTFEFSVGLTTYSY